MPVEIRDIDGGAIEVIADTESTMGRLVDTMPGVVYRAYISQEFTVRRQKIVTYNAHDNVPITVEFSIINGDAYSGKGKMVVRPVNGELSVQEVQKIKKGLEKVIFQ